MSVAPTDPAPPAGLTQAEALRARELFKELFDELTVIGLHADGSTTRLMWTDETAAAGAWFDRTATRLGLHPSVDRNGNRWVWSATPAAGAIVTGSHLDSVPGGGRFDGALGVLTGLVAVHLLTLRGGLERPLAVVSFADEEGGRFDIPTFGSRAMLGSLDVEANLERADAAGITLREALVDACLDPGAMGRDEQTLARIYAFVEVHVEQGTLLAAIGEPLAIGTAILPHGRWRLELTGEANHAGTTELKARRDPMPALAAAITAARAVAGEEHALATVGKVEVAPNSTNSVAGHASLWLDARAADAQTVERVVERVVAATRKVAEAHQVALEVRRESFVGAVHFSSELRERVVAVLAELGVADVPMATGAGHDAGALAAAVPTAMLFVRSATGASHSQRELASAEDCEVGIGALTAVLAALAADNETLTW
jgi:beta-ureidopropionase / N-carbamoyl-L-amino-acid hydrolase